MYVKFGNVLGVLFFLSNERKSERERVNEWLIERGEWDVIVYIFNVKKNYF